MPSPDIQSSPTVGADGATQPSHARRPAIGLGGGLPTGPTVATMFRAAQFQMTALGTLSAFGATDVSDGRRSPVELSCREQKSARVTIRRQPFTVAVMNVNTSLIGTDSVTINLCR